MSLILLKFPICLPPFVSLLVFVAKLFCGASFSLFIRFVLVHGVQQVLFLHQGGYFSAGCFLRVTYLSK